MNGRYSYKLYNDQFKPRRHIMDISASSPENAIKQAGFDWIEGDGGKVIKTRTGLGYTNCKIFVYLPETIAASGYQKPDFTFERQI